MARHSLKLAASLVIFAVLLLASPWSASAFSFELDLQSFRCFTEEYPPGLEVLAQFDAAPAYSQVIDFTVSGPSGTLEEKKDITRGELSFIAQQGGEYSYCFYNHLAQGLKFATGLKRHITFTVKSGTETIDYKSLATKQHLKPIEVELKMMEDVVKDIYDDMSYMRRREADLRNTDESTNSRVTFMSLFSFLFLVSSAVFQTIYFLRYFQKKKVG